MVIMIQNRFWYLKVINYDIVMPHYGFVTHPHRNIEIIIYVTKGLLHIETHMETMAKLHLVIFK